MTVNVCTYSGCQYKYLNSRMKQVEDPTYNMYYMSVLLSSRVCDD